MAMETEKLQLDQQLVNDAITFFLDSEEKKGNCDLGFYLVKLEEEKVLGTLLVTFEN